MLQGPFSFKAMSMEQEALNTTDFIELQTLLWFPNSNTLEPPARKHAAQVNKQEALRGDIAAEPLGGDRSSWEQRDGYSRAPEEVTRGCRLH